MPRESTYQSIILKKQPYNEADEIITLYTREAGKLRVLAKSSKFSKSKLQYALQLLFLIDARIVGRSGLAKIIGAEIKNTFSHIRQNLQAVKICFYAAELVLKATPDEQPSTEMFDLLVWLLSFLDQNTTKDGFLDLALVKFQINFLDNLGYGISFPELLPTEDNQVGFSNSQGGFASQGGIDYIPVSQEAFNIFKSLNGLPLEKLDKFNAPESQTIQELRQLLSGFISYQLEREIKSEDML